MKGSEWSNPLCCCEYYNIEEERSHILACCCNCQDLDDAVEDFLTGQRSADSKQSVVMATIQDRLRVPWRGGAKQVSLDTMLPIVLVPLAVCIAALDLIFTVTVMAVLPIGLSYLYRWFRVKHPRTKFYAAWTIVSAVTIAVVFEVKVIALLEILPEENLILGVTVALYLYNVHRLRNTYNRWQQCTDIETPSTEICTICKRPVQERTYHCKVCQVCVDDYDWHFIWYDCCIGRHNRGLFVVSLLLAIFGLLYGSNLTLTTVCHPFTVVGTILLPDDCSEVYERYDMALCFVTAIYSLLIAVYLIWILFRQCLIISFGLTGRDWQQLPAWRKFCICTVHNSYSRGCYRNWLRACPNRHNKLIEL